MKNRNKKENKNLKKKMFAGVMILAIMLVIGFSFPKRANAFFVFNWDLSGFVRMIQENWTKWLADTALGTMKRMYINRFRDQWWNKVSGHGKDVPMFQENFGDLLVDDLTETAFNTVATTANSDKYRYNICRGNEWLIQANIREYIPKEVAPFGECSLNEFQESWEKIKIGVSTKPFQIENDTFGVVLNEYYAGVKTRRDQSIVEEAEFHVNEGMRSIRTCVEWVYDNGSSATLGQAQGLQWPLDVKKGQSITVLEGTSDDSFGHFMTGHQWTTATCTKVDTVTPGKYLSHMFMASQEAPIDELINADTLGEVVRFMAMDWLEITVDGLINRGINDTVKKIQNAIARNPKIFASGPGEGKVLCTDVVGLSSLAVPGIDSSQNYSIVLIGRCLLEGEDADPAQPKPDFCISKTHPEWMVDCKNGAYIGPTPPDVNIKELDFETLAYGYAIPCTSISGVMKDKTTARYEGECLLPREEDEVAYCQYNHYDKGDVIPYLVRCQEDPENPEHTYILETCFDCNTDVGPQE